MAEITSLRIERQSLRLWMLLGSDSPDERASSLYQGSLDGDYITLKTSNGAIIYDRVRYDYIDYYDNTDPDNNLLNAPTAKDMFNHLLEQGFLVNGIAGSGTGGVDALVDLVDVFIKNYAGRAGQVLVVNQDGTGIVSQSFYNVQFLEDLLNAPSVLQSNKLLMTSSVAKFINGKQTRTIVQVDPIDYINRPPAFDEISIYQKGYTIQNGVVVPNEEEFAKEIGDYFQFLKYDELQNRVYRYIGRWNGGDPLLLDSYSWDDGYFQPIPGEPGYTP